MGWFSSLGSFCKSVCHGAASIIKKSVAIASSCASKVVDTAVKVSKAVASGCKAVIDKFTGKDVVEKAKKKWEELQREVAKEEKSFNEFTSEIQLTINGNLEKISEFRRQFAIRQVPAFQRISSRFACWEVEANIFTENFAVSIKKFSLPSKSSTFKIDFDAHPFKSYAKAILTLGFLSRKEAQQTLTAVEGECQAFRMHAEQNAAERIRLTALSKSLKQIADWCQDISSFYDDIIGELDFAVNALKNAYFLRNDTWYDDQMDCYFLPKRHLLCLMAADKMTRIMHKLASQRYVDNKLSEVDDDFATSGDLRIEFEQLKEKLAA